MVFLNLIIPHISYNIDSIRLTIPKLPTSKQDISDVIEMMKEGTLKIDTIETTFDKVPEGLDLLREGKVTGGRLVMVNK